MIVPGIVLAGGRSTRMGRPKALLPATATDTFVSRVARTLRDGGVDDVVVVAGIDGPLALISEALAAETSRLAATLATQAPVAVRRILEAVHHGLDMSLAEAAVFEASTFGLVYGTEDVREGTAAFLEKRKPRFTGR